MLTKSLGFVFLIHQITSTKYVDLQRSGSTDELYARDFAKKARKRLVTKVTVVRTPECELTSQGDETHRSVFLLKHLI